MKVLYNKQKYFYKRNCHLITFVQIRRKKTHFFHVDKQKHEVILQINHHQFIIDANRLKKWQL